MKQPFLSQWFENESPPRGHAIEGEFTVHPAAVRAFKRTANEFRRASHRAAAEHDHGQNRERNRGNHFEH